MAKDWRKYRTDGCIVADGSERAPVARVDRGQLAPSVDLRAKCSAIEDQQTIGCCCSCALVGAHEYLQRKLNQPTFECSVLYSHYNGRMLTGVVNADAGVKVQYGIGAMAAHGLCEERLWPFDVSKAEEKPPKECYANGDIHEAIKYARVEAGDALMQVLSDGFPVVFGGWFGHHELGEPAKTGRMAVFETRESQEGHSMLIVGYDQAKREWLVRNSWGADYGMAGYLWIPFKTMEVYTHPQDYWIIGDLENEANVKLVGSSISDLVQDVRQNGGAAIREDLQKKRKELNTELQDDLDDAKKSARSRLRDAFDSGSKRMTDRSADLDKAARDEAADVQKSVDRDRNTRGGGRNDGGDNNGGRGG